ncbi:class I SAM-dependent methyltransferase [Actimicrobium sp. CCC2.4]|uniref:class I SAM-dependent methyltransferase n=1 Tax=Actimicrobium sp. CCC2.4 TaxID=3048606 RepID=UPI002AC99FC4|nr:class I SAM-dependent methyltransferase [Actimicrobium sp. CCC2.4]MEB0135183.1 class I SAM-dependent methyltransferase [Actimicrobium sp. CCC2.4]WPX30980.1 class I SAM-dependent methyltransferase [Actimicrobium sp. CCC2.4]
MLHQTDAPSAWVQRFATRIPSGLVLDLACGSGRHARLLADAGHPVLAVDRMAEALAATAGPHIDTACIDLENGDGAAQLLQAGRFAGIIVTNYLHRPLLPLLFASLVDGGVLIYETFAQGNGAFGKPSSPAFLLQPGELLAAALAAQVHVLAFEDGYHAFPTPAMRQKLCAIKLCSEMPAELLRLSEDR